MLVERAARRCRWRRPITAARAGRTFRYTTLVDTWVGGGYCRLIGRRACPRPVNGVATTPLRHDVQQRQRVGKLTADGGGGSSPADGSTFRIQEGGAESFLFPIARRTKFDPPKPISTLFNHQTRKDPSRSTVDDQDPSPQDIEGHLQTYAEREPAAATGGGTRVQLQGCLSRAGSTAP